MNNRIEYNEGDIIGECIYLKEVQPINYYSYNGKTKKRRRGLFKCRCGKIFETDIVNIKQKCTKSCGCLKLTNMCRKTHGLRYHPLYIAWKAMKYRCDNIKYKHYDNYGGRGIKVCERWYELTNFIEDMYPTFSKGLEIDRTDNNGNYEPENCKWVTHTENNNNKRDNRRVEYNGEIKTVKQWSDYLQINYSTLQRRLNNMSIEDALTKPFLRRNRKSKCNEV